MLTFIDLFDLHNRGEEVPGMLSVLFYRDSSQNPAEFFKNHLDIVGNDAGLEQVCAEDFVMRLMGTCRRGGGKEYVLPPPLEKNPFLFHSPYQGYFSPCGGRFFIRWRTFFHYGVSF